METDRQAGPGPWKLRRIVVGVDGSPESSAALDWAARIAGDDTVIHAISAVSPGLELVLAAAQYDSAKLIERVTSDLESDWVAGCRAAGHEVVCRVVEDDPADALLRAAVDVDADLVVVGVHSKPKLAPRTICRVTTKLIHRTDRPLAIIEDGAHSAFGVGDTVVSGAGRGAATRAALQWAAGYCERYGTALSLIKAVPHRPIFGIDGFLEVAAFYVDPGVLHDWAIEDLTKFADEIQRSTETELPITWSAASGEPGPRLVEAGADAKLLVVGRHGSAGATHTIQPVLRHVITHAPCPVVVVPPAPSQD